MEARSVPLSRREQGLVRSVMETSWRGRLTIAVLAMVLAWGVYAYIYQLREGLAATAMRDYVLWGLYITNFVFFIGISHVGALMSAILRITHAEWRRPITRMAEVITFSALLFGAVMPIVDLGRPEHMLNLLLHPNWGSPIVWDLLCIFTYLVGSSIFLYLPMIPDIALLRDLGARLPWWRRALYRLLALNWRDTPQQHERLERAMTVMAVLIIPIAIAVHTVVSFIFSMTLRPGWNSTIFGPYFVVGALVSGAAGVIVVMAILRRVYHLEAYITLQHFRNLALLVLTFDLFYIYFNIAEYFTLGYKMEQAEQGLLAALMGGSYAPAFWLTQIGGLLVPAILLIVPSIAPLGRLRRLPVLRPLPLALGAVLAGMELVAPAPSLEIRSWMWSFGPTPWLTAAFLLLLGLLLISLLPALHARPIAAYVLAGVLIVVQAWVKRYLIVVPTLLHPFLPMEPAPAAWLQYHPTWVEWSITLGAIAGFALVYALFTKVFPIISLWETRETAGHTAIPPSREARPVLEGWKESVP